MTRYKIENLPIQLLDRLADYAKMDWWYDTTYYHRKTVNSSDLTDLFNAFLFENLVKFTVDEVLELYKCLVLTGNDNSFYNKELIKTLKQY